MPTLYSYRGNAILLLLYNTQTCTTNYLSFSEKRIDYFARMCECVCTKIQKKITIQLQLGIIKSGDKYFVAVYRRCIN